MSSLHPQMVDARRFYGRLLRLHGYSPEALGWSREGQTRRFQVLTEVGNLEGAEVLDLGCGLGHLYDFIRARVPNASYRGVDMLPRLVASARRRHPQVPFDVSDVLGGSLRWRGDFAFASGVLNLEMGGNEARMHRLLRVAFNASRKAAAVNMLSTWADWYDRGRHYYDPVRMLRAARRLTRWAVLRHDYLPHDFTIYLYHGRDGAC